MAHTLTVTIEDEIYRRLQEYLDDEQIGQVIERLLRRFTITQDRLSAGYAAMAADEEHEAEALAWIEAAPDDGLEDEGEDWSWLRPQ